MKIRDIALVEMENVLGDFTIYDLVKMPRGVPLLAAELIEHGYNPTCFVESIQKFDWRELLNYDSIGFGAITCTVNPTYQLIRKLRQHGYAGQIVVGGPHATALPTESLEAGADAVVRNEGDLTFPELLAAYESDNGLSKIAGISWRLRGSSVFHHNHDRDFMTYEELCALPFPAFKTIIGWQQMNVVPFETSRGCPKRCKFCAVAGMYGTQYRHTTVEWRINWLETLKRDFPEIWQKCIVFFTADNFFGGFQSKNDSIEMMKQIIAKDLIPPRNWICQMRVEDGKDGIPQLMKEAGNLFTCVGIESADDEVLKHLHKEQTVKQIQAGLTNFKTAGIDVLAMTITGTDEGNFWSYWRSIRKLNKWGITYLQSVMLVTLPGTEMTKRFETEGRKFSRNYDKYNGEHPLIKPLHSSKFGAWASVYLIGFFWFYVRLIFKPGFKYKLLILYGFYRFFVQFLKWPWRTIKGLFRH